MGKKLGPVVGLRRMPLQLFLNELSAPIEQLARAVSVAHLQTLVAIIRQAQSIDPALVLNSDVPLANLPLGEGTTVASVRNDGDCVEESLYLKTVNNRAPLKLAAAENSVDPDLCEYRLVAGVSYSPFVGQISA